MKDEEVTHEFNGPDRITRCMNHILSKTDLQDQFRVFLDTILLSLNSNKFFDLAKLDCSYETLKASRHGNPVLIWKSWTALQGQKSELSQQLQTLKTQGLLPKIGTQNGYLEIGFPGRMVSAIRDVFPTLIGTVYAATTQEKLGDYIECGFPRSYDVHVDLTNYAPLTRHMDAESVSVVSCFIGLHHCPNHAIDDFVQSIADVLRPGGHFLLRDHDVGYPDTENVDSVWTFASMAHTAFNIGTGVSELEEAAEIRNFHSLAHWDALLLKHGLARKIFDALPLQQAGDPTRNCMVCYTKVESKAEVFDFNDMGVVRPQLQTFMTSVEWHSVRMAQDYATFINHTPFYMFPFMTHLGSLWSAFWMSLMEARRYHGWSDLLSSAYFWMSLFIVIFHTFEFVAKAVVSAPIAAFYTADGNAETDTIDVVVRDLETQTVAVQRMPRYRKFCAHVLDLSRQAPQHRVCFLRVAGQTRIQVQCTMPKTVVMDTLLQDLHCHARLIGQLCNHQAVTESNIVYLNVDVKHLLEVLRHLESIPGVSIDYIHDF